MDKTQERRMDRQLALAVASLVVEVQTFRAMTAPGITLGIDADTAKGEALALAVRILAAQARLQRLLTDAAREPVRAALIAGGVDAAFAGEVVGDGEAEGEGVT